MTTRSGSGSTMFSGALAVLFFSLLVPVAQAQLGQTAAENLTREEAMRDLRSPRFWTPASYGRDSGEFPITRDRSRKTVELTGEDLPWSGNIWSTVAANLAFRGGRDQSPLEKHDTLSADARASSAANLLASLPKGSQTAQGMNFAGAAKWEGDPRSGYNTAKIEGADGAAAKRYVQVYDAAEGVKLNQGGSSSTPSNGGGSEGPLQISEGGNRYTIHKVTTWNDGQGKTYEIFWYWLQGTSGPEGRFVRLPPTSVNADDGAAQWWHKGANFDGQVSGVTRTREAASRPAPRSGAMVIEYGGEEYTITRTFRSWLRYNGTRYENCDFYYYDPVDLEVIPGQQATGKENKFIRYQTRGGEEGWVHVYWSAEEYKQDPTGYDGHCNGFAAASILFKQPTENLPPIPLRHKRKLRLNVTQSRRALEANREAQDGWGSKPIDYDPIADEDEESPEIVLEPRDVKGLMTAAAMWVTISTETGRPPGARGRGDNAAFGTRVDFGMTEESHAEAFADIHPHHMHRILLEYIHERKRAVVMDRSRGDAVWNVPIYGYYFNVATFTEPGAARDPDGNPVPTDYQGRGFYRVDCGLKTIGYADEDYVGPPITQNNLAYRFDLILDESNRVVESRWVKPRNPEHLDSTKNHPDFLWVPQGFAEPRARPGARWPRNLNLDMPLLFSKVFVDARGKSLLRDFADPPAGVTVPR